MTPPTTLCCLGVSPGPAGGEVDVGEAVEDDSVPVDCVSVEVIDAPGRTVPVEVEEPLLETGAVMLEFDIELTVENVPLVKMTVSFEE